MDGSALVLWKFCILGIFIVGCHGGNKWQKEDKSITCYQCNSEYDPRCGDPFDPYTLGSVNCSMKRRLEHMKDIKPVLCRKTVQKVQGRTRVVRGCGYITDERDDKECFLRTGTKDVHVTYCSCTKNLCNTGHIGTCPSIFLVITAILAALAMKLTAMIV